MLEIIISDCFNIYGMLAKNITVNLSNFLPSVMVEDNLSRIGKNLASSRLFLLKDFDIACERGPVFWKKAEG